MKKIIFTTTIILLLVSCTVTKQTKMDYSLVQQDSEINTSINPSTGQVTQTGVQKSKTEKVTASSTTEKVQEKSKYNPFRYNEEWKIKREQAHDEAHQAFLARECDALQLQKLIEDYNTTEDIQILYAINGNYNCSEVIDFAINLINNSLDKELRKLAIGMLGFRRYYDAIPLLLEYVKKEISPDEKIAVASTLAILDRKAEALEIFDCNCYVVDYMDYTCVNYYFYLSEDRLTGLNYFDYFLSKPQTRVEAASYLAKLGVEDKTFSVFAEFLKKNTDYQLETEISLLGLAAIGTEKSFELLKIMTQSENEMIAKRSQEIYKSYYVERRTK